MQFVLGLSCAGSVAELEKHAGRNLPDIHRHCIDDITIPDPRGSDYPPLRRVEEVSSPAAAAAAVVVAVAAASSSKQQQQIGQVAATTTAATTATTATAAAAATAAAIIVGSLIVGLKAALCLTPSSIILLKINNT
ncbi:hypothetical protein Emag_002291 [Eimeria magna]